MHKMIVIAALAALAAPATVLGFGSGKPATPGSPAKQCHQQRASLGKKTFGDLYGAKHSMATCAGKVSKSQDQSQQSAVQQCRDEQAPDPAAFAGKYGTNPNKKNAFGKCVAQKATEQSDEVQDATIDAAKQCRDEQAPDPAAFAAKYGTNPNKKNAFGKCVSGKVKQATQSGDEGTGSDDQETESGD